MNIKYIEVRRHPGNLAKITCVVDGDLSEIAKKVNAAGFGEYELKIEKIKKKRSLDANAYYWVLLDKLARVLGISTDEAHRHIMNDYGTIQMTDERPLVFSLMSHIDPHMVVPYFREIGRGTANGKEFTHYVVLKGSHEMDTQEFSRLVDGLVSECKDLGIETMTPDELERLKGYERCA